MGLRKSRRGPLKSPNFRWLALSSTTSALGDAFGGFALLFLVLEAGGNAAVAGAVVAAVELPGVLLALLGGVWADRLDRVRLMVVSDIGRAVFQAVLFALFWTGAAAWWHVALFGFLTNALGCVYAPSVTGVIPQTVADRHLTDANGLLHTGRTAAVAIGTAAGGTVIAMFGASAAIAVNAVSFVLSALFLSAMRLPSSAPRAGGGAAQGVWQDLRAGWSEVRRRSWLLSELLRSAVEMPIVVAPFAIIGPLMASDTLGGAESWATISIGFLCGSLCGPFAVRLWKPRRPIWACTALMYLGAVPPLLLALTTSVPLITLAEGVKGAAVGFFGTIWASLLQREIPDTVRSRVNAWDYTLTSGLMPLGYLLAGLMVTQFGRQPILILGVVWNILAVTLVLALPGVRRFRIDWNASASVDPPTSSSGDKTKEATR
ncbi:MFS transporter [Streptomyces glaucosporus]|uniref:MFS transporter n=1 Tax=Streptomyces glaucosporus TaxID=284044 RepID=A0ABP5VK52_9ACTN